MKRRGRKNKTIENSSNGVTERQDQNGETSERDEQDSEELEDKRKKTSKRKSASKKVEENLEENLEDLESDDKRKKLSKRKSASKKSDEDAEQKLREEPDEPDEKRKKLGKRKSTSKKTEEENVETQYEVEQVLDEKMIQGVRHYLIRWKGYEPESDTWEPESTLSCPDLIANFKIKKMKNKSKMDKKKGKKRFKSLSNEQATWDENEDFEVDRILDVYFKRNGQREFLVSWKGYSQSHNSWEPEENMDCKDLIKKFMDKVEKAKEAEQRELRVKRTHTDRLTLLSDGHLGRRLSKRNLKKQRVHYYDAE